MPSVRIRVGCSLDQNTTTLFRPLIEAATRARQQIDQALGGRSGPAAGAKGGGAYRTAPDVQRDADAAVAITNRSAARRVAAEERAREHVYQIKQRYLAKEEADAASAFERTQARNMRGFRGTMGTAATIGRGALGVAGGVAKGMGVNFDLASMVSSGVSAEKKAIDLTNAGYMPGEKGPNGQRQDAKKLMADVREVGAATATDTNAALDGLAKFVGKTGDLQTGREIFKDLAILSRATGTNLDHMVDAAGDVSSGLGETENKGSKVLSVMRAMAGQGKLGAVEIKDLAKQMAGLAANAGQFGNDETAAMASLGALAQEARQRGGAKSAAQAVTAVQSFTNTFSKGARRKQFKAAGVTMEDSNEQLLDPEEIIVRSLRATKGKKEAMGKLFMDANARRVTRGFETIYNKAGGGDKGEDAVRAEFKRLRDAAMGQGEIAESFARSMAGTEAKAQLFQNRLELIAVSLAERILPAFEKAAPGILKAVDAFAGIAGWASENPLQAVVIALAASAGKAAIGEAIGGALSKAVAGAGATWLGPIGIALGAALAAAALIDAAIAAKDKAVTAAVNDDAATSNAKTGLTALTRRGGTKEEIASAMAAGEQQIASMQGRVARTEEEPSWVTKFSKWTFAGSADAKTPEEQAASKDAERMKTEIAELKTIMGDIKSGTLKVHVVNQPTDGPKVDPAGRSGP